jgi:uncharacterized protein YjbI with pentapeptide repeats
MSPTVCRWRNVVCDLVWVDDIFGSIISKPLKFTKMPIGYSHAFGGPGFVGNPAGKGHKTKELPNIESPESLVQGKGDQPNPGGFGPLNPLWPIRAKKVGKNYGASYKKERAPFYSDDFDWGYFNAAPRNQQLTNYLHGNEEIFFQNMHPKHSMLKTRLPGIRIRAFLKNTSGVFREVFMNLDTLFADTDKEHVTLTWRGLDTVEEDDLTDIASILVAEEGVFDPKLPAEHYQALLKEAEEDPLNLKEILPEEYLKIQKEKMPIPEPGADLVPVPTPEPELPPEEQVKVPENYEETVDMLLEKKFGNALPKEREKVRASLLAIVANNKKDPVNLEELVGQTLQKITHEKEASPPPIPVPQKPPRVALAKGFKQIEEKNEEIRKTLIEKGKDCKELDAIPEALRHPKLLLLDPTLGKPAANGEFQPGADLSFRDLTGYNLSGLDLRGCNLEGAILTRANLHGTKLMEAYMKDTILFETNLIQADLTGANLSTTNFASAIMIAANLSETTMKYAYFNKADMKQAQFTKAVAETCFFSETNLTRAVFSHARLDQCDFESANLSEINANDSEITRCLLWKCQGRRAQFKQSRLDRSLFAHSDWNDASFEGSRAVSANWTGSHLKHTNFSYVFMPHCHFSEVKARGVIFYRANLRESRFYRAQLPFAEFIEAKLFGADFRKAMVNNVKFSGANLYDAKLLGTSGAGVDFQRAILTRSTLDPS